MDATITLYPDEPVGIISPLIYGQLVEHVGRGIEGGIWDPDSPLSDERGFRLDVLEKVKVLAPTLLRFPGGTVSKTLHWEDGVGSARARQRNLIWGGEIDHRFGTDEFLDYCERVGAVANPVVNMASGSAEEAGRWVEYCNAEGGSDLVRQRAENGHAEAHRVPIWGLGNEEFAKADVGTLSRADGYIERAWEFAKLMKLQDSTIRLVVCGSYDSREWNARIMTELSPIADLLSLHFYVTGSRDEYGDPFAQVAHFQRTMRASSEWIGAFDLVEDSWDPWHRFPMRAQPPALAIDEWGLWDVSCARENGYNLAAEFNWRDALVVAGFLNGFIRNAGRVRMAAYAQLVNVLGAIRADERGSVFQTVATPLGEYRKRMAGTAYRPDVDCDDEMYGAVLDVSATQDCVAVVNRSPDSSVKVGFEGAIPTGGISFLADHWQDANRLTSPDHDVVRQRNLTVRDEKVTLPPCSLSFIHIGDLRRILNA